MRYQIENVKTAYALAEKRAEGPGIMDRLSGYAGDLTGGNVRNLQQSLTDSIGGTTARDHLQRQLLRSAIPGAEGRRDAARAITGAAAATVGGTAAAVYGGNKLRKRLFPGQAPEQQGAPPAEGAQIPEAAPVA